MEEQTKSTVLFHNSKEKVISADILSLTTKQQSAMLVFLSNLIPCNTEWYVPYQYISNYSINDWNIIQNKYAIKVNAKWKDMAQKGDLDWNFQQNSKKSLKIWGFEPNIEKALNHILSGNALKSTRTCTDISTNTGTNTATTGNNNTNTNSSANLSLNFNTNLNTKTNTNLNTNTKISTNLTVRANVKLITDITPEGEDGSQRDKGSDSVRGRDSVRVDDHSNSRGMVDLGTVPGQILELMPGAGVGTRIGQECCSGEDGCCEDESERKIKHESHFRSNDNDDDDNDEEDEEEEGSINIEEDEEENDDPEIESETVVQKPWREDTQRTFRGQFAFQDRESGMFFQAFEFEFTEYLWQTYDVRIVLADTPVSRSTKPNTTGKSVTNIESVHLLYVAII